MAVYANSVNEIPKCKTIGFYDSNYILIKKRDPVNKSPLVNLSVITNTEIYQYSL